MFPFDKSVEELNKNTFLVIKSAVVTDINRTTKNLLVQQMFLFCLIKSFVSLQNIIYNILFHF